MYGLSSGTQESSLHREVVIVEMYELSAWIQESGLQRELAILERWLLVEVQLQLKYYLCKMNVDIIILGM